MFKEKKLKKSNEVVLIPSRLIVSNPYQPRKTFNWNDLDGLAESIYYNGLVQPISVRKREDGKFELISGERRFRACKMAGMSSIPSIIIDSDEKKSAIFSILENMQRENLNFFEEAMAIDRLIKYFNMTQEEAAVKLGKSKSEIANKLKLLRLPNDIRYKITLYNLSERHAGALLRLPSDTLMNQVLDTIAEQGLTVSETDKLINNILKSSDKNIKDKPDIIYKDVRVFINTINHAVTSMRNSGINAIAKKNETEKFIEYTVKIEKMIQK